MANDDLAQRAEELAQGIIGPLILGKTLSPVRPFGARLALAIGEARLIVDDDLRSRVNLARVRRARLLAPVDLLPDIDAAEWALAAGLNDLLQVTNHELSGPLTRKRTTRLLASVRQLVEKIPSPRHIEAALARHATFSQVLELTRTDTVVSWWTGQAKFRGQPPSRRLMLWGELRRVHVTEEKVPLATMTSGIAGLDRDEFLEVFALWLTRSPLTDIASMGRKEPAFAWSASTLSLLATPFGRTLARRALVRQPHDLATETLARASRELPKRFAEARRMVESFVEELSKPNPQAAG